MAIKVMIDSASDIGEKEAKEMGIIMVPMIITIGYEEFYDGVNITPREFYEKLIESDELPKTTQINPYRFEEAIKENLKDGDELLIITISSKLSGTYSSALQAAIIFDGRVRVIDSMNAAIGERILCEYALRLIDEGVSFDEIVNELEEKKSKIHVLALIDTLEYLKKGGRISSTVAFAGELISLKPVIGVVGGEVKMVGKAIGSRRGNNLLNRLVESKGGIDFTMPYGTIWSGLDDSMLQKYINDSASLWEGHTDKIPSYILGGTIGTHIGPGAIGVAFFEK